MVNLLLAFVLWGQVVAGVADSIGWTYLTQDAAAYNVTTFLVCLDNQPTSACTQVPLSAAPDVQGIRAYTWKLPALLPGDHTITVQACTAQIADCSSGERLNFTFKPVIPNVSGLGLKKAGA